MIKFPNKALSLELYQREGIPLLDTSDSCSRRSRRQPLHVMLQGLAQTDNSLQPNQPRTHPDQAEDRPQRAVQTEEGGSKEG